MLTNQYGYAFVCSLHGNYLTRNYGYGFYKYCIKTKYSYYYWLPFDIYMKSTNETI